MSRDLFAEPIDRALVGLEEAGEAEEKRDFPRPGRPTSPMI